MAITTADIMGDPRRRNLAVLSGLTVLFVILAAVAVFQRAQQLAPKFSPRAFFPDLAAHVNDVAEVAVTSKSGTFHVRQVAGKGWVVVERDAYPADEAQVRAVAAGMAELEMTEPKTSRPDWLNYVGLGDPAKGGDAVEIALKDASGKTMADLLVGHVVEGQDALGRSNLYVRRPSENQVWQARGYLSPRPSVADWTNKMLVGLGAERVRMAQVTPVTSPPYTLAREARTEPDFKVTDLPQGRELAFPGAPDAVAQAIVGLSFQDVAKANSFDFNGAPQSVITTFDGLQLTVKLVNKGSDHWASVSAAATMPAVAAEAAAINARTMGWAFQLDDEKAAMFLAPRENLLKPLGGAMPAPQ